VCFYFSLSLSLQTHSKGTRHDLWSLSAAYRYILHRVLFAFYDKYPILPSLGGAAQSDSEPNHEFGKFGPLRSLSEISHLPHGRRTDNSHIFVANHNRRIAIGAAFVSNIGHNIQLFAKSFRQRIRNAISDALTKAFFVIFACG